MEFLDVFCGMLIDSGFVRIFAVAITVYSLGCAIRYLLRILDDSVYRVPVEELEEIKEECEHVECSEDDCKYIDDDSRYDYYERWLNDKKEN